MKQHFSDHWPIYVFFALFTLIVGISAHSQDRNRREHGKIEKLWGCEFIKFYQGNHNFQYIHSPKCSNCAGNK